MALPVILPDMRLLARQPFLWWFDRIAGANFDLEHLEQISNPPLPDDSQRPHPFPFVVTSLPAGVSRLKATLYWMRLLDYFHWDWTLHFESVPHLLELLLQEQLLQDASRKQKLFVKRERVNSLRFWRDGVVRLVQGDVVAQ
eukprot:TRINITY_DN91033_c0_g1_i1.p1 TRINITY_DN91033_c0_g1~~TRINITY_DN91033_c0_g1_i1.p1  ORF type:complete len:155 (-),score=20.42 TRINITY_DN91033_c0_g1_i1:93-518(-)